ncbi:MAG TPA: dUTP diphosphatase [Candidatus Peribacterales bacterium]|nr:dUTP diphosphatase [Candidatus Peribacterales bacterium]
MKVAITRIDKSLPLPRYESNGATGFDLITRETTIVEPGKIALVPSNVIVKVPEGYTLLIIPRSSLPRKKALVCPHSLGVIDQDYCGPEDEIKVQVQNISTEPVTIEKGERIAQGLFVRVDAAEWMETEANGKSRGGFGSTGTLTSSLHQSHTPHDQHARSTASSAG